MCPTKLYNFLDFNMYMCLCVTYVLLCVTSTIGWRIITIMLKYKIGHWVTLSCDSWSGFMEGSERSCTSIRSFLIEEWHLLSFNLLINSVSIGGTQSILSPSWHNAHLISQKNDPIPLFSIEVRNYWSQSQIDFCYLGTSAFYNVQGGKASM